MSPRIVFWLCVAVILVVWHVVGSFASIGVAIALAFACAFGRAAHRAHDHA